MAFSTGYTPTFPISFGFIVYIDLIVILFFCQGGAEQLGIQLCGIVVIVAWVTLWSLPMFLALRYFHKLRFGLHFCHQTFVIHDLMLVSCVSLVYHTRWK